MLRRLVVILAVLMAASAVAVSADPAAAHTCSGVGEVILDPTPDDQDDDCVTDSADNCPGVPNADQIDSDYPSDLRGDRCDNDDDNDGLLDPEDNCRTKPNPLQTRTRHPVYGDACLFDDDSDGTIDAEDNCPTRANVDQADNERDGAGNTCDADDDNDGLLDEEDNCALNSNKDQADTDSDRIGNACDPDTYTGPAFVAPPVAVVQPKSEDRTKATVRVKLPGTQRGSDARGGMPTGVGCSEACSVSAELTLSRAVAKRLKVNALVARGEAALDGAGTTFVFLDFTRTAMKRLFRGPAVKATLALKVVDAAGNATSVRRALRLAK